MDELHGFYRRLRQRQYTEILAARGWRITATLLRWRPLYAVAWRLHVLAASLAVLHRFRVRQRGLGLPRSWWRSVRLGFAYQVNPQAYYRFRLYEEWPERHRYLYETELKLITDMAGRYLCPEDAAALNDKVKFAERCEATGLPAVPVLATFRDGAATRLETDEAAYSRDLFSKFADQFGGAGAEAWRFDGFGYAGAAGSLSPVDLFAHLAALSRRHPVLLQPRVFNCAEVARLAGETLATVRIVTVREAEARFVPVLANFRMGVGGNVADNFDLGGIGAVVDLETGRLGRASWKDATQADMTADRHSDTGVEIADFQLPHWAAARSLAVTAHAAFPAVPTIGWDIALSEQGPVLVEGNSGWSVQFVQMTHRRPVGDEPAIVACLLAAVRQMQHI